MKVIGLISAIWDPSSRARIIQYKQPLSELEVDLRIRKFNPKSIDNPANWMYRIGKLTQTNPWRYLWALQNVARMPLFWEQYQYDLIWQNRQILRLQSYHERKLRKPRLFDFDDAIWLHDGESSVASVVKSSAHVVAGNEYLADFALKHNKSVSIIPSVIDTEKLYPVTIEDSPFTIGWIGSVYNLQFLNLIKESVLTFLEKNNETRLIIVSSEPGNIFKYDNKKILFRKWTPETENELINSFSVGIMPLEDTAFTRGKCSYKMLQYLACGVPAIVSPVGMNNKLLKESIVGLPAGNSTEWTNALTQFYEDFAFSQLCSINGRKLVVENYSLRKWAPLTADIMKKLVN